MTDYYGAPEEPLLDLNLYDLLDALIDRVPWKTDVEPAQWKDLTRQLRKVNLFGYLSTQLTTEERRK